MRGLPSREKLALLRNFARVGIFDPRLMLAANRLTREAQQRGALQKRSEFAPLLALLLRRRPRRVLEIGRGSGGSLWAFCRVAADDALILSVDLPEGPYGGRPDTSETRARNESSASPGQVLRLVQGDSASEEIAAVVRSAIADVDLLFIDGDHTLAGVQSDYETYLPLVRPGGLVVFHDIVEHDAYPEVEVHRLWSTLSGPKVELLGPQTRAGGNARWGGIGILFLP